MDEGTTRFYENLFHSNEKLVYCLSAVQIVQAKESGMEETHFQTQIAWGRMQVSGLFVENRGKCFPALSRTCAIDSRWVHGRNEQFQLRQNFFCSVYF